MVTLHKHMISHLLVAWPPFLSRYFSTFILPSIIPLIVAGSCVLILSLYHILYLIAIVIVLTAAWFQILPSKILEISFGFNHNIDVTFNIFVFWNFHSFDLNFFLIIFKLLRLKWQDNGKLIFAFCPIGWETCHKIEKSALFFSKLIKGRHYDRKKRT